MFTSIIQWLESHMMPCFYKQHFGIECPGCGMQRSAIELLKGNLMDSFILFPALIPLLTLLIYTVLHIRFSFQNGTRYILFLFFLSLSCMIVHYIVKLIF